MSDKYVEKFRQLSTCLTAYMRDVSYPMHHDIRSCTQGAKVIGRAFTVKGPDIYLNALESITEGAIYVHAGAGEDNAIWSGWLAKLYGRPRRMVGAVIDGGATWKEVTAQCQIPTFARFFCPRQAINRQNGIIQVPLVCGGALVCPGDIVLGDDDGVVVIPRSTEEDVYKNVDGFLNGMALFRKLAQEPGIVITEHGALKEMFTLKYQHPYDYWRYYEPWAAKWQKRYGSE